MVHRFAVMGARDDRDGDCVTYDDCASLERFAASMRDIVDRGAHPSHIRKVLRRALRELDGEG